MIARFKKIWTQSKEVLALQTNTEEVLAQLTPIPILDGIHLTGLETNATGDLTIGHKLQRAPVGWLLTDLQDAVFLYRISWTDKLITFKSLNNTNTGTTAFFNVWVF